MSSDIYTAASAGLYALRKLDVVSNNLANANTAGFKAQRLVSREQTFEDTLASKLPNMPERARADHERTPGVTDIATMTDFSLGSVTDTGNPLNVALVNPKQFFVVQTEQGEAYTRAGNFTLNANGELVTPDGKPVLGEGGPIAVPPEGEAKIAANGTVTANNEIVGQIRVVEFDDLTSLERTEGTRFRAVGPAPRTVEADLLTSSLEMPNISIVTSMIEMIEASRSFESYTKVAQELSTLTENTIRKSASGGGV